MSRTRMRYGPHRSNVADLWLPDAGRGDVPVVVLVHGGFWRAAYTKVLMNGLAQSVNERGWAAWNIEYRRLGAVGGGGGWPTTFDDVDAAVDHLATLQRLDLGRVVVCGHSAGGHLALWTAARHAEAKRATASGVTVRGALSLAGIVDLREADRLHLGGDATARLLGGHWEQQEARYRQASPAALLPLGVPQVLVHGLDDGVVPATMSEEYHVRASQAGDAVRYLPVDGAGHRDLIAAGGRGWGEALAQLELLIG
ncbi:MAG: alpha/beta hydrolase [Acidimicrobiales bacterium]